VTATGATALQNPVGDIDREPNHDHHSAARREANGGGVARTRCAWRSNAS
jgi:hypothetical protein